MSMPLHYRHHRSPLGELIIGVYDDQLILCDWRYRRMRSAIDKRIAEQTTHDWKEAEHPVIDHTIAQLSEYLDGDRTVFTLPMKGVGTAFQKKVWGELVKVPYGKTTTYLELSERLGDPKAIRAVASANGANAISILVPCHRVIGRDGSLTGYAGGLRVKQRLLRLEAENSGASRQLELDFMKAED